MHRSEINKKENKKELLKIFKYLTKHLKIKKENIEIGNAITSNNQAFFPYFFCYLNEEEKQKKEILIIVTKINLDDEKDIVIVAKNYFYNFSKIYFVLIFDVNLKAHLFYKKENQDGIEILMLDDEDIIPFYKI